MAALDDAEIQSVLDAWPADDAGLPVSVQAALDSWSALTMNPINTAITILNDDPASVFTTPRGRGYLKMNKVRTLVAHGVAVPGGAQLLPHGQHRRTWNSPEVSLYIP